MARFTPGMLWSRWHARRGTESSLYADLDSDVLVAEIYAANNARIAATPRYPRLAAVNGVRVQA